ncbi:MAG: DUF1223 domain-containing protein [Myxococcaceae bacterium]
MNRWLAGVVLVAALDARGAERAPVLVELFTSEGCSSCPPADEALSALEHEQPVSGAQIIPLELHVDYWNSLGWADPFSLPEATARQEQYAAAGASASASQLFTPQMVVDGTRSFVGNAELARAAVAQAVARPKRLVRAALRSVPGGVDVELQVGPGEDKPATLWLVLTESGLSSRVTRGENRGRTLFHAPVVRSLEQVATVPGGGWTGTVRLALAQAWRREALKLVAFAQERPSGRVVGVATAPVPAGNSASSP